ncbi:hypothetical protein WMY93_016040 [Mugilogobius chulae]|uniref:Dynein regulatory complex protein 1/2 N-terminal domain-containing protein n=1 Tax=Mugilogobius chulae TaxID=88201 RepID=A0AAW0NW44_9GOBI
MTEEEMSLYRQAQEEMEQRKQQTVTQFLKDKLREDEKSLAIMQWKLHESVRTPLRFGKVEAQRSQTEVLKQTQGRQLDAINRCFKKTTEELNEKEQHLAQMYHLKHFSQLNKLQTKYTAPFSRNGKTALTTSRNAVALKGRRQREDFKTAQRTCMKNQSLRNQFPRNNLEIHHIKSQKLKPAESNDLLHDINIENVKEQILLLEEQNRKLIAMTKHDGVVSRNNLIELSEESDKAAKSLQKVIAEGEMVLRMAVLCKKKEDKTLLAEELHNIVANQSSDLSQECDFPELNVLMRLHNVAADKRSALRSQRDALSFQNKQLHFQIQAMQEAPHNMEIKGGYNCSPLSSERKSTTKQSSLGHVSTQVLTPKSCSTPGQSPVLNLCPELSVSPALTVQHLQYKE